MAQDDRTVPILTHVLAFLFGWLAPLIILLITEAEQTKQHARRALNWQLSLTLYSIVLIGVLIVSIPLSIIIVGIFTLVLSIIALVAVSIADIVFSIIAAVRASNDELYTYPLSIRFVSDPQPDPSGPSKKRTKKDPVQTA